MKFQWSLSHWGCFTHAECSLLPFWQEAECVSHRIKRWVGKKFIFVMQKITFLNLVASCLVTKLAEIDRLFMFPTLLLPTNIKFRLVCFLAKHLYTLSMCLSFCLTSSRSVLRTNQVLLQNMGLEHFRKFFTAIKILKNSSNLKNTISLSPRISAIQVTL